MARVILVCDDPDNPDDAKCVVRYDAEETKARRAVVEAAKDYARALSDELPTSTRELWRAVRDLERVEKARGR